MKFNLKNIFYSSLLVIIVILAIFLRFYHLGSNAYWIDEILLVNQLRPSFEGVCFSEGSAYTPVPRLFLIILKISSMLFGMDEFVLRFLPCLFGCLSVILFFLLCKKLSEDNYFISVIATTLFAFNLRMLQYSQTVKTYSGEIFLVLLLYYLTELYLSRNYDIRYFIAIFIASIVGLFLFFPIIFIIPILFLRVFYVFLKEKRVGSINDLKKLKHSYAWVFYLLISGISFMINYFFLTPNPGKELLSYWKRYFLSWFDIFTNLPSRLFEFFIYLFYYAFYNMKITWIVPALFAGLFLLGLIYLITKRKYVILSYFLIPFFLVLLASLLGKYPFGGARVDLFLMPLIFLIISYGLYFIFSWVKKEKIFILISVLVFLVCFIPALGYNNLNYDSHNEDINSLRVWYDEFKQPSDYTYITLSTLGYYQLFYHVDNYVLFPDHPEARAKNWSLEADSVASTCKDKRLWILSRYSDASEKPKVLSGIIQRCTLLDSRIGKNSAGYLFSC